MRLRCLQESKMYRLQIIVLSELIEDVILPPPGMKRRGREAKTGEFAIEKKKEVEMVKG